MSALRVFSLASIPERYANLAHIIPVILAQADVLHIHWVGYKTPVSNAWQDPKIIHHTWAKAGSQIRFQPYALYSNAYFFSIDDDILYPPNYAETMIRFMQANNNQFVCCVHANNHRPFQTKDFYTQPRQVIHFTKALTKTRFAHIPGCGTACLYTPNAKVNWTTFSNNNMSDVYMACLLAKQHIPVVAIAREANWLQSLNEFDTRIFGQNPHAEIDKQLHRYRYYFALHRYWFRWRYRINNP